MVRELTEEERALNTIATRQVLEDNGLNKELALLIAKEVTDCVRVVPVPSEPQTVWTCMSCGHIAAAQSCDACGCEAMPGKWIEADEPVPSEPEIEQGQVWLSHGGSERFEVISGGESPRLVMLSDPVPRRERLFEDGEVVVEPPIRPGFTIYIDRRQFAVRGVTVSERDLRSLPSPPIPDDSAIWLEQSNEDVRVGARSITLRGGERFYTTPNTITAGASTRVPDEAARERIARAIHADNQRQFKYDLSWEGMDDNQREGYLQNADAVLAASRVPSAPGICGVVCACGPNGEPLACGYEPHDGPHSWVTLPTFGGENV